MDLLSCRDPPQWLPLECWLQSQANCHCQSSKMLRQGLLVVMCCSAAFGDLPVFRASPKANVGIAIGGRQADETVLVDADLENNRVNVTRNGAPNPAVCRDSDLSRYISDSLVRYIHDMGALTTDILNQIKAKKYGTWLVHAEVISNQRQGPDWQSVTNGNLFTGQYYYGCYYHDNQTYILVLRLY